VQQKLIMLVASGGGGEKLLQAQIIRSQIVFQFGDAIFHFRSAVVVAPNLFRRQRQGFFEESTTTREVPQFSLRSQPCSKKCGSASAATSE
jgi:hypothetical protein